MTTHHTLVPRQHTRNGVCIRCPKSIPLCDDYCATCFIITLKEAQGEDLYLGPDDIVAALLDFRRWRAA